jgi:hypothetical protein
LRTSTTRKEAVDLSSERKHRRKNLKTPQNSKNSGETPNNKTKQIKSPCTNDTNKKNNANRSFERERERETHTCKEHKNE